MTLLNFILQSLLSSVLVICGADDAESLSASELERFERLSVMPLRLNMASRNQLVSSGLFTPYQAASLKDYISLHGDVLSLSELALIDGFDEEYAKALAPFVSLYSKSRPGSGDESARRQDELQLRAGAKRPAGKDDVDMSGSLKYRHSAESCELALAMKEAGKEEVLDFYGEYHGKGILNKLVVGDYNLRFGQGLTLWTGMTIDDYSSIRGMSRSPTGLSPSWSISSESGSCRGVAADFSYRKVDATVFAAGSLEDAGGGSGLSGKALSLDLAGFNVRKWYRKGDFAITGAWQDDKAMLSLDGRLQLGSLSLFGELASKGSVGAVASSSGVGGAASSIGVGGVASSGGVGGVASSGGVGGAASSGGVLAYVGVGDMAFAAKGGMALTLGDCWRSGLLLKAVPSDFSGKKYGEYGLRCALEYMSDNRKHSYGLSGDAALLPKPPKDPDRRRIRAVLKGVSSFPNGMTFTPKLTAKLSNYEVSRYEARFDLQGAGRGSERMKWAWKVRGDVVYAGEWGALGYAELSGNRKNSALALRLTGYSTPSWNSRIYCYEREAPGGFYVPAYYGKGAAMSLIMSMTSYPFNRLRLRAYLKTSAMTSGRLELKFTLLSDLR